MLKINQVLVWNNNLVRSSWSTICATRQYSHYSTIFHTEINSLYDPKITFVYNAYVPTYIIASIRFWLDHGNLAAAVRYVDSLKGASRAAADKWFQAARAHLEVRQAAEAVLAHASAMALQYI